MMESIQKDLRDAMIGRRACRGTVSPFWQMMFQVWTEQAHDCITLLRQMKGGYGN